MLKITNFPWTEIGDTLDTIMQYGAGPTTVQVDYRVTRPLTNVLVLLLAQNAPLRWALSERAIILPPLKNKASLTTEGKGGTTPPQQ